MKIEKGKVVAVHYKLYISNKDGDLVEETEGERPFKFIFGIEPMLEQFDDCIEDLTAGSDFSVAIACDDAYGPDLKEAIIEFPKSTFIIDGEIQEEALEVGEVVPMTDEEGTEIEGIVVENDLNSVTLDFNHPLAGEDLYFEGHILEVREATPQELEDGLPEGE